MNTHDINDKFNSSIEALDVYSDTAKDSLSSQTPAGKQLLASYIEESVQLKRALTDIKDKYINFFVTNITCAHYQYIRAIVQNVNPIRFKETFDSLIYVLILFCKCFDIIIYNFLQRIDLFTTFRQQIPSIIQDDANSVLRTFCVNNDIIASICKKYIVNPFLNHVLHVKYMTIKNRIHLFLIGEQHFPYERCRGILEMFQQLEKEIRFFGYEKKIDLFIEHNQGDTKKNLAPFNPKHVQLNNVRQYFNKCIIDHNCVFRVHWTDLAWTSSTDKKESAILNYLYLKFDKFNSNLWTTDGALRDAIRTENDVLELLTKNYYITKEIQKATEIDPRFTLKLCVDAYQHNWEKLKAHHSTWEHALYQQIRRIMDIYTVARIIKLECIYPIFYGGDAHREFIELLLRHTYSNVITNNEAVEAVNGVCIRNFDDSYLPLPEIPPYTDPLSYLNEHQKHTILSYFMEYHRPDITDKLFDISFADLQQLFPQQIDIRGIDNKEYVKHIIPQIDIGILDEDHMHTTPQPDGSITYVVSILNPSENGIRIANHLANTYIDILNANATAARVALFGEDLTEYESSDDERGGKKNKKRKTKHIKKRKATIKKR
jgi:hypothetical protein